MNLAESFITALDSILANKMRSVLTMLGVIIGVASVIALLAIGNGFSDNITSEISAIGSNLISVFTDSENSGGYPALSVDDVAALSDPLNTPAVTAVSASVQTSQPVSYAGEALNLSVTGITPNYLAMTNSDAYQLGDGLTQNDEDTQARVAILGARAASDLFGTEFPVGQMIKVGGTSYEVIGVLEESGGGIGGNTDTTVFVPLSTALSRLSGSRTRTGQKAVSDITLQAAAPETVQDAIDQITETLREQHGTIYGDDDDFLIFDQSSLLDTIGTVTAALTTFLGAIAAISLLVGGIGIMNIMLVSVTERTREIGIRKAIGAQRRDILTQFLLESLTLSLLGGAIGILLGLLISFGASQAFDINLLVDVQTVLMSATFAAIVGLVFGIYPAWRASRLAPIEALRYE